MWGDQHGQIIGLKKREREVANQRRDLESRVARVIQTLREGTKEEVRSQARLIAWAADQLEMALHDTDITPFNPDE